MFEALDLEVVDKIAIIRLNRPKAANGLNSQMAAELKAAAKACDANSDIKVVILTGEGRFFCAGGDIKEMASNGTQAGATVKALADDLHAAISVFSRMDKVVIVAVNGVAAGAGFSMAVCGDLVVAADIAKFTMAYTNAGLSPDGSSTYFLPRLIGMRRTQELMLTNRTLLAQEALDWGLVNRVVPADDLLGEAKALAQTFVSGSKGSHSAVKKLLMTSFANSLETQMELEGREISARARSKDGQEGIAAFMDKRPANFE